MRSASGTLETAVSTGGCHNGPAAAYVAPDPAVTAGRAETRRRAAMVSLLGPSGRLHGDTAGMHMFLELPCEVDNAVATEAQARGVAVVTLRRYFSGPPARHGLVLGYGAASVSEVTRACQVLAEILAAPPVLGPGTPPRGLPPPR